MKGKLYVVGLGPGDSDNMTRRAYACISACDVLVGYTVYIEQIAALSEGKEIIQRGMGQEIERCRAALEEVCKGKKVAIVCSGDSGLYGMAGLTIELLKEYAYPEKFDVEIVPGITSALSCSSLLGAPIVEDFCTISLSDYMVPWDKIMARVKLACEADFVIALYNPKSRARADYLRKALDMMLQYRKKETPVGIVRNAYREDQSIQITTLGELDCDTVDMFCTLVIGNSNTYISNGFMVTARGYNL